LAGLFWLGTGTGGGLLLKRLWTFGSHKMEGIASWGEGVGILVLQEELSYVELSIE